MLKNMQVKPPVEIHKNRTRDNEGKYVTDEPLVKLTVSNPLTAFRLWLTKLITKEGIDVSLKVRPLTAIAAIAFLTLGGFGLGRITLPQPLIKYIPQLAPAPTPEWKDTAFTGMLRYSAATKKFYLETQAAEAITLEAPTNVNLTKYVSRRIFATGRLNTQTGILVVADTQDLELLPTTVTHIPTVPTPTNLPSPEPS